MNHTRFHAASNPEPTGEIRADTCDQMSSMS